MERRRQKRTVLGAAVGRLLHMRLACAWETWREAVEQRQQQLEQLQVAVAHFRLSTAAAAFSTWRSWAEDK